LFGLLWISSNQLVLAADATPTATTNSDPTPLQLGVTIGVILFLLLLTLLLTLAACWWWRTAVKPVAEARRRGQKSPLQQRSSGKVGPALLDDMDPASGVRSLDPATPNTVEYTFLSLPNSVLIKHGQFPEFPLALSKSDLDFDLASAATLEPDVDSTIEDRLGLSSDRTVAFWFAPVSSPKFTVQFEPQSGVVHVGELAEVRVTLTPLCTTTIDVAIALHAIVGDSFEDVLQTHASRQKDARRDTDGDMEAGRIDNNNNNNSNNSNNNSSGSGSSSNKRKKRNVNVAKHTFVFCRLRSALSTKLDYDELHSLEPVGVEGSYGSVSYGVWRTMPVAVKLLRVQTLSDPRIVAAFEKEMMLMSKLKHKNVVQVHGVSMQPGKLAVVTEWVKFGGVDNFLGPDVRVNDRLPMTLKLKVAWDAAEALGFLHRCSILHRNLKPSNVLLLTKDPEAAIVAKITDFGSSRTMTERVALAHRIGVGRPAYMAPEILSLQPYSVNSDVYSFAMVLYVLIAEQEPFAELSSHWDVVQAITAGQRPPVQDAAADAKAPLELAPLIDACWASTPQSRPDVRHVVDVLKMLAKPHSKGASRSSLKIEKRPAHALKQRFSRLLARDERESGTSTVSDTFSDDSTSQSASHSFVRPAKYVGVRATSESDQTSDPAINAPKPSKAASALRNVIDYGEQSITQSDATLSASSSAVSMSTSGVGKKKKKKKKKPASEPL